MWSCDINNFATIKGILRDVCLFSEVESPHSLYKMYFWRSSVAYPFEYCCNHKNLENNSAIECVSRYHLSADILDMLMSSLKSVAQENRSKKQIASCKFAVLKGRFIFVESFTNIVGNSSKDALTLEETFWNGQTNFSFCSFQLQFLRCELRSPLQRRNLYLSKNIIPIHSCRCHKQHELLQFALIILLT